MEGSMNNRGILRRIETAVGLAIKVVIGLLLVGMVVLVFMNVIYRYFLNSAIAWSEEISRFMMIWLSFLGAVIAFIHSEHLGLDLITKAVSPKVSRLMTVLADVLVLVALGMLVSGGYTLAYETMQSGWVSPATETPYGVVYMVVPFSAALLFLQAVIKLIEHVQLIVQAKKGAE